MDANDAAEVGIDNQGQLATDSTPDVPVPIIEFIQEQRKDSLCREIPSSAGTPRSGFSFKSQGVLVHVSRFDGSVQKVVPTFLRQRVSELSHTQISQGHPGETRLYQNTHLKFYWPLLIIDLVEHVHT